MDKKWKLSMAGILLIIAMVSVSGYFLVFANNTNNNSIASNSTSKTVFSVDGPAQIKNGDNLTLEIPVHKTVNQTIWFMYTPYKNGIPSTGFTCMVPAGIDTHKTFNLEVFDTNLPEYDSVDILAYADGNHTILLQKEHVIIPK